MVFTHEGTDHAEDARNLVQLADRKVEIIQGNPEEKGKNRGDQNGEVGQMAGGDQKARADFVQAGQFSVWEAARSGTLQLEECR